MLRTIIVAGVTALTIGAVVAQANAIASRKATMKRVSDANAEVTKMSKGEAPFNLQKVQAALRTMSSAAGAMPKFFPPNSMTGGDTAALPKIWEAKADFNGKFAKLGRDARAGLRQIKDEASFKMFYGEVTKNCGGCHETYRAKRG